MLIDKNVEEIGRINEEDIKENMIVTIETVLQHKKLNKILERFSSQRKFHVVVAWIMRWIKILANKRIW